MNLELLDCADNIIFFCKKTPIYVLESFCIAFKRIHKFYFCNVLGEKIHYDSDDDSDDESDNNDEVDYNSTNNLIDEIPEPDLPERYEDYYESSEKSLNKYTNYVISLSRDDDLINEIRHINV